MGLDMYLCDKNGNEVMCWRKANQVRRWFVDHNIIQDDDNCIDRLVTVQNLQNLLEDCKKVLENHSLAEELLPCGEGFFFGSYEYDEWYFNEIKDTVEKLEPILKDADKDHDHFIYSDWW